LVSISLMDINEKTSVDFAKPLVLEQASEMLFLLIFDMLLEKDVLNEK